MCEFKVFLNDEQVSEDVVFVEASESGVLLRDILGLEKRLSKCRLSRVSVEEERVDLVRE
ncbi:MAG: CooT family nickel-binding protein [Anaerolineae bacterium]|nr:CooT family nickel-binding protein [Anaerolineae bacterium]NIN97703.1 CooT family nickel-binding protein [Anaerolineae bacterium]NIQ80690.1 CooT family nickel-binding protein [Anaerolineae bacterium]